MDTILHKLTSKVMERCLGEIVEHLEPDGVLDMFVEKDVFHPVTKSKVRDIREEGNTSRRNRRIQECVWSDPKKYHPFKLGLANTMQTHLIDVLGRLEVEVHDSLKGEGEKCHCNTTASCHLLKSLRCPVLPPSPGARQVPSTDTINSVQKHLISMYDKYYQRVPIYPLRSEWRHHVSDLFVNPSLTIMNPRGIRLSQTLERKRTVEIGVKTIRDIFYSGNTLCKDIFITGESGKGKSTLCEYLVHLWVQAHSASGKKLEEEIFMGSFTLLFYISLREANRYITESCDVAAMISAQLNLDMLDVSKLILDQPCLIILDGLDELSLRTTSRSTKFGSSNLPAIRHSDKCTVLTTSRPWKLELLAMELEGKIERLISLNGLEMESQWDLVEKIVSLLNSEYSRNVEFSDFFHEIDNHSLYQHLETPVILTQMLGLWFAGESIGDSQCSIYSKIIEKQLEFTEEVRGIPEELQTENRVKHQTPAALHDPKEQTENMMISQFKLPTCLGDQAYCHRYKSLLLKLSRLAYRCLFGENQDNALVFDHNQMEICGMSNAEILQSLHIGLLTQHKVFGEITQRLKAISFIHKSHQEFFAAMYLSQMAQGSALEQLLECFSDLDNILKIEKVFTFVSGMNPDISCKIATVIMDKASKDSRVQRYRGASSFYGTPYEALVKRIQALVFAGIEEGKNNGHDVTAIPLQDIWMKDGEESEDFPLTRILACTQSLDLSHVRSIFIRTSVGISRDAVRQLVETTSPNLHKLVLYRFDGGIDMFQTVVRRNPGILQALGLYYEKTDNVDISEFGQKELQEILSAPKCSLGLFGLILTHSQLEFLFRHLSAISYRDIRLGNLKCTSHGNRADDCKQTLDLSASKNLRGLQLVRLLVEEVVFIPGNVMECTISYLPDTVAASMICCLRNAVKLEKLECYGLSDSAVVELEKTLPYLVNLKVLVLDDVNLSGHEQVLLTSDMKQLELIELYSVALTAAHFQRLLSTISSHRVGVVLGQRSVGPVTITNYDKRNDITQQIRDNPNTDVEAYEVAYEDDTCVVKEFWFYTNK